MTLEGILLAVVTASLARIILFTDAAALDKMASDLDHEASESLGPIGISLLLWVQSGSFDDMVLRLLLDGACVLSAAAAICVCVVAVSALPGQPVRQWLQGSRGLMLGSVMPVLAAVLAFAMPFVFMQSLVLPLVPAVLLLQLPLSFVCDGGRLRIWRAANSIVAAFYSPIVAGMALIKLLRLETTSDPSSQAAARAAAAANDFRNAALFDDSTLDMSPADVAQQVELVLVMLLALAHMALALAEHCRCIAVLQFALKGSKHIMASSAATAAAAAAAAADGAGAAAGQVGVPGPLRHSFWYVLKLSAWLILCAFAGPITVFGLVAYWQGYLTALWPPWAWELLGLAAAAVGFTAFISCPAMFSTSTVQAFMAACGFRVAGGEAWDDNVQPLPRYVKASLFGSQQELPDCSGWYVVVGVDGYPALVHLQGVPASLLLHHQQQLQDSQQQQQREEEEEDGQQQQQQQQQQRFAQGVQELQQQVALAWLYACRHAAFTRAAVLKLLLAVGAGMVLVVKHGAFVGLAAGVQMYWQAAGAVIWCTLFGRV
jgi:hypothetical protein